jgi:predicted DNA-binding transcriptional regulator AlpA
MIRLKPFGLLTQRELAEELQVSRQTLTNRMKAGTLPKPVISEGNFVLWRVKDIKKVSKK